MKLSVSVCFWGTCGCGCITSLIRQNIELWTTHTGKQAAPPVHPRRLSSSPSNRATSHSSTSSPPPASLTLSYRDGLLAVWLHLTVKSSSEDESRFSSSDGAWQESKGHWTCVVLKTGEAAVPLFSFVKLWRKRWKTFKVCHFLCFLKKKRTLCLSCGHQRASALALITTQWSASCEVHHQDGSVTWRRLNSCCCCVSDHTVCQAPSDH